MQVIKVNVTGRVDVMAPGYSVARRAFHHCGLLPSNPLSQSNHEKTTDRPKVRDILQNSQPVLLKIIKIVRNKERIRHRPEETQETR